MNSYKLASDGQSPINISESFIKPKHSILNRAFKQSLTFIESTFRTHWFDL